MRAALLSGPIRGRRTALVVVRQAVDLVDEDLEKDLGVDLRSETAAWPTPREHVLALWGGRHG